MNIEFENPALEELYTSGSTKDHEYNDQYRLLFYSTPDETGIVVNALLSKISKHYE